MHIHALSVCEMHHHGAYIAKKIYKHCPSLFPLRFHYKANFQRFSLLSLSAKATVMVYYDGPQR